jgi:hypothetical protein
MKHKRINTAIYLKDLSNSISSRSSSSSSHGSRRAQNRRLLSGSVYLQAYRWGMDENFSTDFDSFFNSSVEVIVSEIDRISDSEVTEEKQEFNKVMQDITDKRIQFEYSQEAARRRLRNSLLFLVNLNVDC